MVPEDRHPDAELAQQRRLHEAARLLEELLELCPAPGAREFAQLRRDHPALDAEWTLLARGFERLQCAELSLAARLAARRAAGRAASAE